MNKYQTYLMFCLSEEAAEVIQMVSKSFRFGLLNVKQGEQKTNLERLQEEVTDLLTVINMLKEEQILQNSSDVNIQNKKDRVNKYYID